MASWTPVPRVCTLNPLLCRLGKKISLVKLPTILLLGITCVAMQQRNILKYFLQIFGKDQTSIYKVGIIFDLTYIFFNAGLFKG